MDKWTQSVDFTMRECGLKNDWQSRATTTHSCENGKILLPSLFTTPQELEVFLTSKERSAINFRDQIHMYNSMLAFTLLGTKVDESVTRGTRSYSFRIQDELYKKIRSMCPAEG